jgi:DNA invertase Pin-like site-specific DNA recombinase
MANGRFVSYLRVSTEQQGRSGLGVEAQRKAVADYLNGGSWELAGEFVEVESGKRDDRPQLAAALAACRARKATLVIAKLDRLSRDAHFLLGLQKAGVDFVAVDAPHADRFTVGVLALVAQKEREMISERTKAALAAAKARGKKLGGLRAGALPNKAEAAARGLEVRQANADRRAADLLPIVAELKGRGITSASGIARELNAMGIDTPRGGKWQAVSVQRLMARLA